ncbi:hypothetical protein ARZXY2_4907 (plasmid) [Arthrobacter sp. ZXY-2]|nr:hypothetical protein ARZXY2_4907 [Arthrobacter sp. ZXY-2]
MSHLDKFRVEDLGVAEFSYWLVAIRSKQVTPGALVVLPKEHVVHFNDLSTPAAVELIDVLGQVERIALDVLRADRINVVAAMMKDPFIHFHFFPRYEKTQTIFGQEWTDTDWPRAITFRDVETSPQALDLIKTFYDRQFESSSS